MPHTVNEWLTVIAAVASALSALIVWGFASGKFVQRRSDEVDDIRTRHGAMADRVSSNESRIAEGEKARHAFIERVNTDLGRIRHKYELIQQRMDISDKHADERHARTHEQLERIGLQLTELQRQVDQVYRGERRKDPR